MRINTKIILLAGLISIGIMLGSVNSNAQHFISGANSTYNVPAGLAEGNGVIMMHGKTSEIQGKYGLSEANRMPGTVIWTCLQTIKGGTFYTNLGTTGPAVKTFGPGTIDISRNFTPATDGFSKYTGSEIRLSGDDNTFIQKIPKAIYDNGTGFDNLTLVGKSPKLVADGIQVQVMGNLNQTGNALRNEGMLVISTDGKTSNIDSLITATDTAKPLNHLNIGGGTVNVNIFKVVSGYVTVYDGSVVNINDKFLHDDGYIHTGCASYFNYVGTQPQTITPNSTKFSHYPNLGVSNSAKIAGGNINICNNYKGDSDLDMAPGANDFTLTLLNTPALNATDGNHASYTNGAEVRGKMVYKTVSAFKDYTFNNANTKVTFSNAQVSNFGFDIRQATAPTKTNDFLAEKDVTRKITVLYDAVAGVENTRISSFKTMWEAGDELGGFTPLTASTASTLKLAEGYDANKARKKLIRTGATTAVDHANRTITYGGGGTSSIGIDLTADVPPAVINATNNMTLYRGSDILLSIQPQKVVSITNGRWSNPGTWDTGVEPGPMDIVSINNKVWVGDIDGLFGGAAWTNDERAVTDGTTAAKSITIENVEGAGLYIGNNDATMAKDANNNVVFKTVMTGDNTTGIFNLNENANTSTDPKLNSGTGFNGIWIATVTNSYKPVLGGSQFTVNGSLVNNSKIEVNVCE